MRTGCESDLAALWTLRTAAVRNSCASHYAPDVIDAWSAAAPPETMQGLLTAGGALVVEEAGRACGYAILNTATGEIDALFVDPAHQGRGIARSLMTALEDIARDHGLAQLHLSASLNAVKFYEQAGFLAVRPQSYAHRSGITLDSVFMVKRLDGLAPLPRRLLVRQFDGTVSVLAIDLCSGVSEVLPTDEVDSSKCVRGVHEIEDTSEGSVAVALIATPAGPLLFLNGPQYRVQPGTITITLDDGERTTRTRILHQRRLIFELEYVHKFGVGLHPYLHDRRDYDFYFWLREVVDEPGFQQHYTQALPEPE